ncbi:MAG: type II toxin-antitoxin system HicA family toxin [Candidatus Eremiobacteraeota bacterium]|nr:type II toxin-antitoxin system HicA family toxin [Candidatus Eremiobacteraeota bacterium]
MGRSPRIPGRDVLRGLLRRGFTLSHVKGSHHFLRGPGGRVVIVPVHSAQTLAPGTLRSIVRQSGLTAGEFGAMLEE